MDWKKSKHILMITLIIWNLILYRGVQQKMALNTPSEAQTATLLVEELERSKIILATAIPEGSRELCPLDVVYHTPSPILWNDRLFRGGAKVEAKDENHYVLTDRDETLTLSKDGQVHYERRASGGGAKVNEEEMLQETIPRFMERAGLSMEDMTLRTVLYDQDGRDLTAHYGLYERGVPVEIAYTRIRVRGNTVVDMERQWPEITPVTQGADMSLPSATKALFSLVGKPSYRGQTVAAIEPCYYFVPAEIATPLEHSLQNEGRARGAWRVTFEDGTTVVLNPGDKIERP